MKKSLTLYSSVLLLLCPAVADFEDNFSFDSLQMTHEEPLVEEQPEQSHSIETEVETKTVLTKKTKKAKAKPTTTSSAPILSTLKDSITFEAGIGSRAVTLGDATTTAGKKLLGNAKSTSTASATGTVTRLAHTIPSIFLNASAKLPLFEQYTYMHDLKIGIQAFIPSDSKHTLYDGQSTTGAVTLQASRPRLGVNATVINNFGDADFLTSYITNSVTVQEAATVGIDTITAGNRLCTVDHQIAYGAHVKYILGEEKHSLGLGLGFLRTSDQYTYTCEEPPAGGSESGVYDASDATFGDNFKIGTSTSSDGTGSATAAYDADGDGQTFAQYASSTALANSSTYLDRVTKTYTPLAGTALVENDAVNWFGVMGEATANVHEHFNAKSGFGYYWRQFDKSTGDTISAPLFVSATDASMFTAYLGIGYLFSE